MAGVIKGGCLKVFAPKAANERFSRPLRSGKIDAEKAALISAKQKKKQCKQNKKRPNGALFIAIILRALFPKHALWQGIRFLRRTVFSFVQRNFEFRCRLLLQELSLQIHRREL